MNSSEIHAVTGAFGYSGKYIARRLLAEGKRVITVTNSTGRHNPFGDAVRAYPFDCDHPEELAKSLEGVTVLYNTYWVRFNHKLFKHADAVANTRCLFDAARRAGVERVVHVSITNPSLDSPREYFSGKAKLEEALKESGISHAILRPTVLFGKEDILINNICWFLRRFPIFTVFGDGRYRIQPIYVDDLAKLAVEQGKRRECVTINAIGPETFTYRDLVKTLARILGKRRWVVGVPPWVGYWLCRVVGVLTGDVVVTREEIKGLMADLLYVDSLPAASTRLTDWAREHADTLGSVYANELARRKDRTAAYLPGDMSE